ncbi:uncharacterized protein LOC144923696 isoform X1 [Branchiostoma floridae x Branchiostoma belcheri]
MANREHGEWNHPARYQWGAADIYTADHESSSFRPENRHRSKWAQPRQHPVARKDDNAYGSRKDGRKKHSQQCIGPGFYIPRYKRASYPEAVLYPNDDPHPAKRPIYDDFRHPKHVPKPARWEEILEEFDRLWKLSRSYQLKEFRKKADPSRPVSEQNFNKQTDLKYKIPSPRRTRSCPVSPQKARKRAFKPWIP